LKITAVDSGETFQVGGSGDRLQRRNKHHIPILDPLRGPTAHALLENEKQRALDKRSEEILRNQREFTAARQQAGITHQSSTTRRRP
jgi:hypothetical protein